MIRNRDHSGSFRWCRVLLSLFLFLVLVAQTVMPAAIVTAAAADDGVTTVSKLCKGDDGKYYKVTAAYGQETGIPADAALSVRAVTADDEDYETYIAEAAEELRSKIDLENGIRLFDIALVGAEDESVKYQPAEGTSVEMKVRLAAAPEAELGVVHFGDETETLDNEVDGRTVSFDATGFSVYAFVTLDALQESDPVVHSVDDLDKTPVYLSVTIVKSGVSYTYFISSGIYENGPNSTGNLIKRTDNNSTEGAAAYCFEKIDGTDDQFYMYLPLENGGKDYLRFYLSGSKSMAEYVSSVSNATPITVTPCGAQYPDKFYFSFLCGSTTYYLNLRKDENGKGFNGSTYGPQPNFSLGSQLSVYNRIGEDEDVLDLDGKTFGITWRTEKNTAYGLMAQEQTATALTAQEMVVRADPLHEGEDVMIRAGGDIDFFTFIKVGSNVYRIATEVGGAKKYLNISSSGALTLVDEPTADSEFKVTAGYGDYDGKYKITRAKGTAYSLSIPSGKGENGFTARNATSQYEYFTFATPTDLGDDDFVPYSAIKVTVSKDQNGVYPVRNGMDVVVYTRIWNNTKKQYEFYAIDHDGSLVRVYDEGDTIRWAGTQINTLLWKFTEYYYWPYFLKIPNYYYELQNTFSHKYLAPQIHGQQILSDRTIGINLNGRRYGDYSSTILAWDDYRYDYAGLKLENGKLKAVRKSQAQEFYFAIMDDPVPEEFSTVTTVDNAEHGIKMYMVDFNGVKYDVGARDRTQTDVMGEGTEIFSGGKTPLLDLVTTDLQDDGYPIATRTNKSLEELFGSAEPVNHLFLKSIYEESGYFEYNCCQTYATLLSNGNFRVYNQIGSVITQTNSQGHGWFMPYNDISPEIINTYTNETDVHNNPLPTSDPRLGEQLYGIPKEDADYHFGMMMEASFIQSENGLDAWGHDIIFEFAGDDDMWLYVDGELVLDLGGVHSALVGKINFSTGDVVIPDPTTGADMHTTLRDLFEQNYRERNPEATDEEVETHLNKIFVLNEAGNYVFKDYTSHTMKMFYMERGAGASNLHMRFNLTTSTPGQLKLSKTVSGTDKQDYTSARFPFQIKYYDQDYADFLNVTYDTSSTPYTYTGATFVYYENTTIPVEYAAEYEGYHNVFFLKPGEVAVVQFPSDEMVYYVRECNIDTRIYDTVKVNGTEVSADPDGEDGPENAYIHEYSSQQETIGERKVVKFDNHVSSTAIRTLLIEKNLYDVDGVTRLHYADDPTGFRFRIFIGEGSDQDGFGYYRMDDYYVKTPDDYYCRYNYDDQVFESVGVKVFENLSAEQLELCTFTTSPSGAIDKIPADYKIEIRNLLVDTPFMVLERESDIPKGYDLMGYDRYDGSYLLEDEDHMNIGIIRDSENPHILVNNHRGWGLTAEKVWSDADFTSSHGNLYFGVFHRVQVEGSDPAVYAYKLIGGTLRQMKTEANLTQSAELYSEAETSLYFYFKELMSGKQFSDYVVREVMLVDPTVDANGNVTAIDGVAVRQPQKDANGKDEAPFYIDLDAYQGDITILEAGDQLEDSGTSVQTGETGNYSYTVSYDVGEPSGPAHNIRTDTVTNTRPGIRIVKTDANGNPLSDAVFTLTYEKDGEATDLLYSYYYSGTDGLITTAYPENNVTYTLTEIETPAGYTSTLDEVTFTLSGDVLTVAPNDNDKVKVSAKDNETGMITVSIKNFESDFSAVKIDANDNPVANAHFALYREVLGVYGPRKDYHPMTGYDDLVTDDQGTIPGIDFTLPPDTYYLTETKAPTGFAKLTEDIKFSVNATGQVTILSEAHQSMLMSSETNDHKWVYSLRIPNEKSFKSLTLNPQTLVADYGLDIKYNVRSNNFDVKEGSEYVYIGICPMKYFDASGTQTLPAEFISRIYTDAQLSAMYEANEAAADGAATDAAWLTAEDRPSLTYQGKYGTLTLLDNGIVNYQIDTMQFMGEEEYCLVAYVKQIEGAKTKVFAYEKLTYMPATTVYYEDNFRSVGDYIDGVETPVTGRNYGKWSVVSSGAEQGAQAADLANNDSANIFGYDPHYTEFATYSNNTAHKVTVANVNQGNSNKNWPSVSFDFAGTGFDLISVTGGDTGLFAVTVYKTHIDENGNILSVDSNPCKRLSVDTYYGSGYGRVYLNGAGVTTLTPTNMPLYLATQEIIDDPTVTNTVLVSGKYMTRTVTYYAPDKTIVTTPYYYDASHNVTDQVYYVDKATRTNVVASIPDGQQDRYEPNYAYAYGEGWAADPDAADSLYQIPVLRVSDMDYGTYRAVVQPRFTERNHHFESYYDTQNNTTYKFFDLYVDAFRVYDPAGCGDDGDLTSTVVQEAYVYSNEAYEKFSTLKNLILGSDTLGSFTGDESDALTEGKVLIDGGVVLDSQQISEYAKFGPNNELYLSNGMSVAFNLSSSIVPDDIQIQVRKIGDNTPKLKVTYVDSKGKVFTSETDIATSSDLSYSVMKLIGKNNISWTSKKVSGITQKTTGLVIVSNASESSSILSITNLKWTFPNQGEKFIIPDGQYKITVNNKDLVNIGDVLQVSEQDMSVTEDPEGPALYADGEITMSVLTSSSVESLVIRDQNGELIDESLLEVRCNSIDRVKRQWTVTIAESEDEDYTYLISAQSNGLEGGEPLAVNVSVDNVYEEPTEPTETTEPAEPTEPTETTAPADGPDRPEETDGSAETQVQTIAQKLSNMLLSLLELIRMLLSMFGIRI